MNKYMLSLPLLLQLQLLLLIPATATASATATYNYYMNFKNALFASAVADTINSKNTFSYLKMK